MYDFKKINPIQTSNIPSQTKPTVHADTVCFQVWKAKEWRGSVFETFAFF